MGDEDRKKADNGDSVVGGAGHLWRESEEDGEFSSYVKEQFVINVEGFEGPLDLLLALARTQKVDMSKVSVMELADQYLAFITKAKRLRLELAADYLVMAAWLAFLKSKLLLPPEEDDSEGPSADELAAHLAFRLKRLEAMRNAASSIFERKQLGRDVFARGMPEGIRVIRTSEYQAETFELLSAYAQQRQRNSVTVHKVVQRKTWSVKEARDRLENILGLSLDWLPMDQFVDALDLEEDQLKTVLASTFSATLEMARDGALELKQARAFSPLYLRRRDDGDS